MELRFEKRYEWPTLITFLVIAFLCFIGAAVFGVRWLLSPQNSKELPFALIFAGVGLLLALMGPLLFAIRWFPLIALEVAEDKIQLLVGNEVKGQVPLSNLKEVRVHYSVFKPDGNGYRVSTATDYDRKSGADVRPTGIVIAVQDVDDPKTFWDHGDCPYANGEIIILIPLAMSPKEIVKALEPLVPPAAVGKISKPDPERATMPVSQMQPPPQPRSENPFDFS